MNLCRNRFGWIGSLAVVIAALGLLSSGAATILTNADLMVLAGAVREGGTIIAAFDGVVKVTEALAVTTNTTLDASGRSLTLDADRQSRHFEVKSGAVLRLVNVTLVNGRHNGLQGSPNQNGEHGRGGSILSVNGGLELVGCRFHENRAQGGAGGYWSFSTPNTTGGTAFGGAIFADGGEVLVVDCHFASNTAEGGNGTPDAPGTSAGAGGHAFGGAIYVDDCKLTLASTTFTNNQVIAGQPSAGRASAGGGSAWGGAVAGMRTPMTMSRCVFISNQAFGATHFRFYQGDANGGALFQSGGSMAVADTLFAANAATGGGGSGGAGESIICGKGQGGAVYSELGSLEMNRSTIFQNNAVGGKVGHWPYTGTGGIGVGGGIFSDGTRLNLTNCTIVANEARGGDSLASSPVGGSAYGGGVYLYGKAFVLASSTFATNAVFAGDGDGASEALGSSIYTIGGANAVIVGSILDCAPKQTNVDGVISDRGHNLCTDASAQFTSATSRNNVNPLLAPLADNDGPTPTMALLPASPAIDAGDDLSCPPTDQRGVTRPKGQRCDMGAFELAPRLSLTGAEGGKVRVEYTFQASRTNQVSVSTNLVDWAGLGTRVAETNGVLEIEVIDPRQMPERFYKVQIQR